MRRNMLHLSVDALTGAIVCSHHELVVRKTIFTFKFHEIKKGYEGFTANIGVKVRGRTEGTLRVVRGKNLLFYANIMSGGFYAEEGSCAFGRRL